MDTSLKKIYRWWISLWGEALHHISSEKCKLKKMKSTTLLLEWLKSETLTMSNGEEDMG